MSFKEAVQVADEHNVQELKLKNDDSSYIPNSVKAPEKALENFRNHKPYSSIGIPGFKKVKI